nr:type II secretion system F family protein [uncultured Draconibacterium sp.]
MNIDLKNIEISSTSGSNDQDNKESGKDLSALFNTQITFSKKKFSDEKKEEFYSEIGMLLSSGLDIRTIFHLMLEEKKDDKHSKFYNSIYDDLVEGYYLSEALKRTNYITPHEYYSVKIGEESGQLNSVLKDLNDYFTRRIKQKRQLVSTFSYPVMIIVTAIVVITFMLNYIVPMFEDVFKRFSGELPAITRYILSASQFFKSYILLFLSVLLILFGFMYAVRKTDRFRHLTSSLVLRIPMFGALINKIYLARFCQSMSLMSSARIPLITALELMEKIIGFYPFEKAMIMLEDDLMNGKTLHESMQKFSFFDMKLISLTKVGEEVNRLADIYSKLSQQYSEEVQHRIGVLNSMMEPILIIIIGLFVAVILISMYLPMFQMGNNFF